MEITIRLTSEAETKKLAAIAAVLSGVGAVVAEPERELAAALADLAVARKSLAEAEAENDGLRQRVERLTAPKVVADPCRGVADDGSLDECGKPATESINGLRFCAPCAAREHEVNAEDAAEEPAPAEPVKPPALEPAAVWSEFDCDARYAGDAPCDEPIVYDAQSRGHFCALHLAAPRSNRVEWRKAHGHRNTGRATG